MSGVEGIGDCSCKLARSSSGEVGGFDLDLIVSASRGPPGQDPKRCHCPEFSIIWDSLLPCRGPFGSIFAILGPLLGTCFE